MKVKKQGWINIYKDFWGGYYGLSVFPTEEEAKSFIVARNGDRDKHIVTIQIEWEEEEWKQMN